MCTVYLHLLNNQFSLSIVSKVVRLEELAIKERLKVLNFDASGPVQKIIFSEFDDFLLRVVSVSHVSSSLLCQLYENKQQ